MDSICKDENIESMAMAVSVDAEEKGADESVLEHNFAIEDSSEADNSKITLGGPTLKESCKNIVRVGEHVIEHEESDKKIVDAEEKGADESDFDHNFTIEDSSETDNSKITVGGPTVKESCKNIVHVSEHEIEHEESDKKIVKKDEKPILEPEKEESSKIKTTISTAPVAEAIIGSTTLDENDIEKSTFVCPEDFEPVHLLKTDNKESSELPIKDGEAIIPYDDTDEAERDELHLEHIESPLQPLNTNITSPLRETSSKNAGALEYPSDAHGSDCEVLDIVYSPNEKAKVKKTPNSSAASHTPMAENADKALLKGKLSMPYYSMPKPNYFNFYDNVTKNLETPLETQPTNDMAMLQEMVSGNEEIIFEVHSNALQSNEERNNMYLNLPSTSSANGGSTLEPDNDDDIIILEEVKKEGLPTASRTAMDDGIGKFKEKYLSACAKTKTLHFAKEGEASTSVYNPRVVPRGAAPPGANRESLRNHLMQQINKKKEAGFIRNQELIRENNMNFEVIDLSHSECSTDIEESDYGSEHESDMDGDDESEDSEYDYKSSNDSNNDTEEESYFDNSSRVTNYTPMKGFESQQYDGESNRTAMEFPSCSRTEDHFMDCSFPSYQPGGGFRVLKRMEDHLSQNYGGECMEKDKEPPINSVEIPVSSNLIIISSDSASENEIGKCLKSASYVPSVITGNINTRQENVFDSDSVSEILSGAFPSSCDVPSTSSQNVFTRENNSIAITHKYSEGDCKGEENSPLHFQRFSSAHIDFNKKFPNKTVSAKRRRILSDSCEEEDIKTSDNQTPQEYIMPFFSKKKPKLDISEDESIPDLTNPCIPLDGHEEDSEYMHNSDNDDKTVNSEPPLILESRVAKEHAENSKIVKGFIEDEAELSGEEQSADEDEVGLDEMLETDDFSIEDIPEKERDDEDLRNQIAPMHLKQMQDEDNEFLKRVKNDFLDEGEFHAVNGERKKKFSWGTTKAFETDVLEANPSDSEEEPVEIFDQQDKLKWMKEAAQKDNLPKEPIEAISTKERNMKMKIIGKKNVSISEADVNSSLKRKRGSLIQSEGIKIKKFKDDLQTGGRKQVFCVKNDQENIISSTSSKDDADDPLPSTSSHSDSFFKKI